MGTAADHVIEALRAGHDELAPLARSLTLEQLRGPSAASEWDVSQVLSHLGSGAVITLAALDAALDGRENPGGDANRAVWARWDAMSPEERQAEFLAANQTLLARYDGLDAATRQDLRIDLGFLPEPVDVATAARFRLNEFALHSWDVRVTLDPGAGVNSRAVPHLLDVTGFMFGWLAKPDALAGTAATLAVTLVEPERTFGLALGDKIELVDVPGDVPPDGTLTLPAEAWLRLVTGRLAERWTPSTVEVTGPVDLALLRRVFPGF